MKLRLIIISLFITPLVASADRPNVLIIMADDMGYSDIGCYGGEIPTPHIDRLAANGLRFTQFYNTARCSQTRAALLTGLYQHQAGMGVLAETPKEAVDPATKAPGYAQTLNRNSVTIAEVLKEAGYRTYMGGKWHLGYHAKHKWPNQRGFDKFYGSISGATSFFRPSGLRSVSLNNDILPPPKDPEYYTTDAFTDYLIQFIDEQEDDAPFFGYLSFTAPHWPLHAREEDIQKFVGKYTNGWDALRAERWQRMLNLGVVKAEWGLSPRDDGARSWNKLTEQQKRELDFRMAVYAAMVHRMDYNIGKVLAFLEKRNQLDNTLIFFLSDNGGCAEPYEDLGGGKFENINNPSKAGMAKDNGTSYGTGWANASNTPFRRYKARLHEGGIATPLIIHWPVGMQAEPGSLTDAPGFVADFMPTILDATGATYPKTYHGGKKIHPLPSKSLMPVVKTGAREQPEWMF
ncbi:MAG: arylsulfatase, partial [Verrucomicrobiota bacterium]